MARLTLRLLVGALCAVIVLIVAAVTLSITLTVSLNAIRDIGGKHSAALARDTFNRADQYFTEPTVHVDSLAVQFRFDEWKVPYLDPAMPGNAPEQFMRCYTAFTTMNAAANWRYSGFGIVFDQYGDGCGMYRGGPNSQLFYFRGRFAFNYPAQDMAFQIRGFNVTDGGLLPLSAAMTTAIAGPSIINADGRFPGWTTIRSIFMASKKGAWFPIAMLYTRTGPFFTIPFGKPLFNSTNNFLGIIVADITVNNISTFLKSVQGTPNSAAFAMQAGGFMVGSSLDAPFYTVSQATTANPLLTTGCATSAATSTGTGGPNSTFPYIGCLINAVDFAAYAPLQKVASEDMKFLFSPTLTTRTYTVSGDVYYVSAVNVPNPYLYFSLAIVIFLPENDILGGIQSGTALAIGLTAAVFVVVSVISFSLVYFLLKPLSKVSSRMVDTAKLRDVRDERDYSSIAEIQDLQKAFTNMNTAIKSFTRYVPKDVVKDLMSTGQLCTIAMNPQRCTMLFVDIASFTTICERVPPDVLSGLVSMYFDRASRIVMDHDGLIDKFIGDCIMAVWGTPFATSNQEVKAVLAGKLIDRETAVEPLSRAWDEAGEQLRVRVGISSGEVLAGNMGCEDRMSYTVIGDAVNLSARLESLNKQFGTRVMVSEMTAEALVGVFVLRLLLPIAVVGKELPVKVYEVMGLLPAMTDDALQRLEFADTEIASRTNVDELSDVMSRLSGRSAGSVALAVPQEQRRRANNNNTPALVRDDAAKHAVPLPLTCNQEEVEFAAAHTGAVTLYLRRDFTGALLAIKKMRETTPAYLLDDSVGGPVRRTNTADKSLHILETLCVDYERHGCAADFDGVYRALEK